MERVVGQLSAVYHSKDIVWNIPNFGELPGEVDSSASSPPFTCGDASWQLSVYPNGKRANASEGRVGIAITRMQAGDREHRVQYTLGISRHDGQVYEEFISHHRFDRNSGECGQFRFANRATLQLEAILPSGELSVFCRIRVERNAGAASVPIQGTSPNPNIARLQQDFLRILRSEDHSDVTLNVRGVEFRAHRMILKVRSSVFASLFVDDVAEKGEALLAIDNCDSDTFPDFLQYLYTGRVEMLNSGNVYSLYSTAEVYDMPDLKETCLEFMRHSLSVDTFCDVIKLALDYDERDLKHLATEFFTKNITNIIDTPKWLDFMSKNCRSANELFIAAIARL